MVPASLRSPTLVPIENPAELEAIVAAVQDFDVTSSSAWSDLDELSTRTVVEALEANPDGVFSTGNHRFEVVGTVYVTLNYGEKRDVTAASDSFPVSISGSISQGLDVNIDDISIDTSSFFE